MYRLSVPFLAVVLSLSLPQVVWSQHHDPHHGRSSQLIISPHGIQVTRNYHDYHYVAPPVHNSHGTFYTYGDAHYYTPPVVVQQPVFVQQPTQVVQQPVIVGPPPQPVVVQFGRFSRTEELATRLELAANELCLEMHHNYQGNPEFAHAYREAYGVRQQAKLIRVSLQDRDFEAIRHAATTADNQLHHVSEAVANWDRHATRQVGSGGLTEKLIGTESLAHHLLYDAGVKSQHDEREEAPPPPSGDAPAPRP